MAGKYDDLLATIIMYDIMKVEDIREFYDVQEHLFAIGVAAKYATQDSSIEEDLKKFITTEAGSCYCTSDQIDQKVKELSIKVNQNEKVHLQSKSLFDYLTSKIIKELQIYRNPWSTAKLVYSLGTLYDDYCKDILPQVIKEIKDPIQKRVAIICARVYFDTPQNLLQFFNPGDVI